MTVLAVSEGVIVSGDILVIDVIICMFLYNVIFQTPGERTRKARIVLIKVLRAHSVV